jgi:hypothetical protein
MVGRVNYLLYYRYLGYESLLNDSIRSPIFHVNDHGSSFNFKVFKRKLYGFLMLTTTKITSGGRGECLIINAFQHEKVNFKEILRINSCNS